MNTLSALLIALLLSVVPSAAFAWSDVYSWTNEGTGVTYNVYVCDWTSATASCAAWVKSNASPLASPSYTLTDTNAFLTEVEIEACNAVGCTRRFGSGFFHDASRVLPLAPSNEVVQ
jgi:hypothetical protein